MTLCVASLLVPVCAMSFATPGTRRRLRSLYEQVLVMRAEAKNWSGKTYKEKEFQLVTAVYDGGMELPPDAPCLYLVLTGDHFRYLVPTGALCFGRHEDPLITSVCLRFDGVHTSCDMTAPPYHNALLMTTCC